MELKSGDILHERYVIESILGQGGMGAVYLARDQNLDQQVAVKINRDPSEQASRQFMKEAQLLAALHHTNLPRVIDYFVTEKDEILVMDYIPGEDLASLIKNEGAQPLEKVLGWLEQLGAALTYMHEQKPPVIHRDIKPGNVKLTPSGEVVLVDFGIAKAGEMGQATATGATGYTPGFAPPEQISRAHTGPYSDQYSLAATIYQLLSGRQPEDGIQRGLGKESLTSIRHLIPHIPVHVENALNRALSLRPEERFKDIDQFVQSMKDPDYKADKGPLVECRPDLVKARQKARRRTLVAGLAVMGFFLIGIATAAYFLLPVLLTRVSQTPEATVDPAAILSTDVAKARVSTQTQIAFLTGLTATAGVPTVTSTPEKVILGGGGELAFVSDRGDGKTLQIWTMPVYMNNQSQIITGEPRQLTFGEGDKTQPSWSPDGQKIMYVASGSRVNGLDIWVMAADGSGAIDLTGQPGNEYDPAWSPNSAVIAYTKPNEDGSPLLYVMRSDGSSVQLLSEEYKESQPTWSADRQWLVFVISAKDHNYLNMRGMQGGSLVPVAFDQDSYFGRLGEVAHPVFSPDGKWIAYTRVDHSRTYIYTVNFETRGNDIQRLTTGGVDSWATWSVDNHWIAFQSSRDGNPEIYVMTSSGQLQTRITSDPARDQQPSWKWK
jgi:eukaryotic-like serine/threonine-protein kinase